MPTMPPQQKDFFLLINKRGPYIALIPVPMRRIADTYLPALRGGRVMRDSWNFYFINLLNKYIY